MQHSSTIQRRKSRQIMVGNVAVGGDAPISVQSMTNTDTHDVAATVRQIRALEAVGADIVRVSVPDMAAGEGFGGIKKPGRGPLGTENHFDYKIAPRGAAVAGPLRCPRPSAGGCPSPPWQAVPTSARSTATSHADSTSAPRPPASGGCHSQCWMTSVSAGLASRASQAANRLAASAVSISVA